MDVLDVTRHNIELYGMIAAGDRVVVAVSGGQDSLCLLHVLHHLSRDMGFDLHIAHLNHGLRGVQGESDAEYVRKLAAEWGIGATVEAADVLGYRKERHLSLEDAARRVRYEFLQRVAAQTGAAAIAVGHTADDQVETIIMHWLRGAGPTGLRGMLPVQTLPGGVRLIRPLLEVTRDDTGMYCENYFLEPRRDLSNDDDSVWRNHIRQHVLPALDKASAYARANILRTARILADEDDYVQQQVALAWGKIATAEGRAVTVDLAGWQALPLALQRRVLREAWKQVSGSYEDLSWLHIEQARDLVAGGDAGGEISLPHGILLQRSYTTFILSADGSRGAPPSDLPLLATDSLALAVPGRTSLADTGWRVQTDLMQRDSSRDVQFGQRPLTEYFDADRVGQTLALRRWRPGDHMQPLGLAGRKKVHDIMIDDRIPRTLRRSIPLLATPGDILWVVGSRRSEIGRVTEATQRMLVVSFQRDH